VEGHRITLHDDPRRVEVLVDGTLVASSTDTVVLEETGLPPRHYFPRADVQMDRLEATPTETVCPFKGQASYWSFRGPSGEHRDVAWAYEHPIDAVAPIAGRLCFYAERTEHRIDGVAQARPESPWSPAPARDAADA
jgi:uncharacterized protein (DUF427 family)